MEKIEYYGNGSDKFITSLVPLIKVPELAPFTIGQLRDWAFNRKKLGIEKAFVKFRGRVFVNLSLLVELMQREGE